MIPKDGNRLFVLMRLLILPLLFALSAPAAAANGGLYRCHALDAVSIQADGKLGRDNIDTDHSRRNLVNLALCQLPQGGFLVAWEIFPPRHAG